MKKTVLLSVLALTASLCADDDLVAAAQKMNGSSKRNMKKKDNKQAEMNIVTLTSARPESDNGWYIFGDAIYWKADVGSTDWVNEVNSIVNPVRAKNHSLNYNWDWGFKAGIGFNMDHDMWDSSLMYTWFLTNHKSHVNGDNGQTIQLTDQIGIASDFSAQPTSGSTRWDLRFCMFDWELGRWHYVSKNIALRPHVGIKGGWINQKIRTSFGYTPSSPTSPASATEKFKNNYWGIGPALGINTLWVLGSAGQAMDHRFSIFGDAGGALMYGRFTLSDKQNVYNQSQTLVTNGGLNQKGLNRNLATAMLEGALGLSWDVPFNSGRNHFMLKVGYELQYWFRQNQLVQGSPNIRFSDDLALQGVTGEMRFDF